MVVHAGFSWRQASVASTPWLASGLEEAAFRKLERCYPPDTHLISAHMLLADVVGRGRLHRLDAVDRRFCWRAHCDFVVVSRQSLKIECVVEIDGAGHFLPSQWVRDKRKGQILARCGIELHRWDTTSALASP